MLLHPTAELLRVATICWVQLSRAIKALAGHPVCIPRATAKAAEGKEGPLTACSCIIPQSCCGLRLSAEFSYRAQSKPFRAIPPALKGPLPRRRRVKIVCTHQTQPALASQRRAVGDCDYLLNSAIARIQIPFRSSRLQGHCQGGGG